MGLEFSGVATTKMTSKGQVVIPEEIREHMHLESGVKFIVMAADDAIVFKRIMPIPENDFKSLLKASRQFAKEHNIKQSDICESIKAVRAEKRKKATKKTSKAQTIGKEKRS